MVVGSRASFSYVSQQDISVDNYKLSREEMCELKVIRDKEVMFDNVIYAKSIENRVVVKDIFGKSREFKNCRIIEVDVNNERLVISLTKT